MFSTPDLFDAHAASVGVCDLQFRSFGKVRRFHGPCVPLAVEADHVPVEAVLSTPGRGRVLVVDASGCMHTAVLGDRLAALAMTNGWAGAVVHGVVRDGRRLDELAFGVKALGTTARRSLVRHPARAAGSVHFGDVRFDSACWVYCDEDAVLVGRPGLCGPA